VLVVFGEFVDFVFGYLVELFVVDKVSYCEVGVLWCEGEVKAIAWCVCEFVDLGVVVFGEVVLFFVVGIDVEWYELVLCV